MTPDNDDLIGKTFGEWTVLETFSKSWIKYCNCMCRCGVKDIVRADSLKSGRSRSCGCLRIKNITKHGASRRGKITPEYMAWEQMKYRCINENCSHFKYYGGRGISVCKEWINDFPAFLAHVGFKPGGTSLDRIDNGGNYEPGNVRWATLSEQNKNKRTVSLCPKCNHPKCFHRPDLMRRNTCLARNCPCGENSK